MSASSVSVTDKMIFIFVVDGDLDGSSADLLSACATAQYVCKQVWKLMRRGFNS